MALYRGTANLGGADDSTPNGMKRSVLFHIGLYVRVLDFVKFRFRIHQLFFVFNVFMFWVRSKRRKVLNDNGSIRTHRVEVYIAHLCTMLRLIETNRFVNREKLCTATLGPCTCGYSILGFGRTRSRRLSAHRFCAKLVDDVTFYRPPICTLPQSCGPAAQRYSGAQKNRKKRTLKIFPRNVVKCRET